MAAEEDTRRGFIAELDTFEVSVTGGVMLPVAYSHSSDNCHIL